MSLSERLFSSFSILFFIVALALGAALVLLSHMSPIDAFLLSFIVCGIGFEGLWLFAGNFFISNSTASSMGWPADDPFQKELAFAGLALAAGAFIGIWIHGNFWFGLALMNAVFRLGTSSIRLGHMREKGNRSDLVAGPSVYLSGIAVPLITLVLAFISFLS